MTTISSAEREAQRVAHLVLEQPRPKGRALPVRPAGLSKAEWKAERKRLLAAPVPLAPGIEEQVALREVWGGSQATPQTRQHVAAESRREGAIARLVRSGALDAHQLAASEEIRIAHDAITGDVGIRTARLERGISGGARPIEGESFAQVARQLAYSRWRATVAPHSAMLLAIIVDDLAPIAPNRPRHSCDPATNAALRPVPQPTANTAENGAPAREV